MTLLLN